MLLASKSMANSGSRSSAAKHCSQVAGVVTSWKAGNVMIAPQFAKTAVFPANLVGKER
jgi:hypothetical protein